VKRAKELLPAALTLAVAACLASSSLLAAQYREGLILLKPRAGLSAEKFAEAVEKGGGRIRRKLRGVDVHVIEVPVGQELSLVNAFNKRPDITFAEPDLLLAPDEVPNDPNYSKQWHLPLMQAPGAWSYASGNGVTVAICDTGIDAAHPDLSGQLVPGYNTASNSADTSDIHGHGTSVAGVVAAKTNNAVGVASVAPSAKIMPMRITDRTDGYAYYSDMAECVAWAADNGARVANISFSGVAGSAAVSTAAASMRNKTGGVVVVSAGNEGADKGFLPDDYLFVAGATTSSDTLASYSNYGAYVDVTAPGSSIYTTTRGGGYGSVSGTSFASPNTAATVALVMSANPTLTATDVTAVITGTARDLGTSGWDAYYGHGRIDALAAANLAANGQTTDVTAPSVAVAKPVSGATVGGVVPVDVQSSDDFGVVSVELLVNGNVVATEVFKDPTKVNTYSFAWDSNSVYDGTYKLGARARDAVGNTGVAQEVSVTVKNRVDQPPVIESLSPADGATVSGKATLSATASDDVGIASLVLSVNGFQCSSLTASVSCTWNLRNVTAGWYTLTATATDTAGRVVTRTHTINVTTTTGTKTPPGGGRNK
jgi:hypothetical protein